MLRMRMSRGIGTEEFAGYTATIPELGGVFDGLIADGLVEERRDAFVPSERGWLMGNAIFGRIWDIACVAETSDYATETPDDQKLWHS